LLAIDNCQGHKLKQRTIRRLFRSFAPASFSPSARDRILLLTRAVSEGTDFDVSELHARPPCRGESCGDLNGKPHPRA
jgi:hypothetical protein